MSDDILTRSNGFFTVLAVHREDVATALSVHGPDELRADDDWDAPSDAATAFADSINDASMEYLARKLGDRLMDGADYYETVAYIASGLYEGRTS